jgi:hypothetical protein
MRRILGTTFCLLGLTAVVLLSVACGQNEGGRCQVNSDCASGLICNQGSTGNGTCGPQIVVVAPTNDASSAKDDLLSSPEAGEDVSPSVDVDLLDSAAAEVEILDAAGID